MRLPDAVVYLVPLGHDRYELYTEPSDDTPSESDAPAGFFRQRCHRMQIRWHKAVETARRGGAVGRWARMRDWAVCRAAESIAEQRTLWSLRKSAVASLAYPSDLSDAEAAAIRSRLLMHARSHHGKWGIFDGLLFVVSGALVLLPGPNVFAYYFGLRLVGHYLSWRGAKNGLDVTVWDARAEPALAELGQLAAVPRESRTSRVQAIADALNLPRLAAFFDRVAA
jgi:hypothetical protein